MKKRILVLIIILLLTTGCECEYNLTIDGNTYKEKITLIGETSNEITSFNNKWEIPIDKEEYNNITLESDSNIDIEGNIYKYNLSSNRLTFSYDFSKNQYANSTAVSNCYNNLTISNYNNTTIISTSSSASCFENHPPLTSIKVNIKVDNPVISNNADSVSGNTYTWNINKSNASNKSINLIIENETIEENKQDLQDITNNKDKNNIFDEYVLYIFLGIIALMIYFGYKWFLIFKEKNNNIEDDD